MVWAQNGRHLLDGRPHEWLALFDLALAKQENGQGRASVDDSVVVRGVLCEQLFVRVAEPRFVDVLTAESSPGLPESHHDALGQRIVRAKAAFVPIVCPGEHCLARGNDLVVTRCDSNQKRDKTVHVDDVQYRGVVMAEHLLQGMGGLREHQFLALKSPLLTCLPPQHKRQDRIGMKRDRVFGTKHSGASL